MPWAKKYDLDILAIEMEDFVTTSGPVNIEEITVALGVPRAVARRILRHYRKNVSNADKALIVEVAGRSHHVYSISTEAPRIRQWADHRLDDAETRLITVRDQIEVAVRHTDGRTIEGQRARAMRKCVVRMIEDIDDMTELSKTMKDTKRPRPTRPQPTLPI